MASSTETRNGRGGRWRFAWGVAVIALLLPFVAMQFTSEVNWTGSDFIFAAVLTGGVGLLFELAVRMSDNKHYRAGVGLSLAASFLTIWAIGAVGMIGDEGNPQNFMFAGVLLLALLGSVLTRFRAAGMATVMGVAAAAQLLASMIGMFTDLRGGIYSAIFAAIWLASAAKFRKASAQPSIAA